jgi:histidine phosphotransferase ChpT
MMDDLSPAVLTPSVDAPAESAATEDSASTPGSTSTGHELATQLVAKLCHDFISPAGAIMSGLDLLEDPSAQDMRQEALNLISTSAKKLVTLVYFARVAFGAATTSEAFSGKELNKILSDIFDTMRAELEFDIAPDTLFAKPAARALVNLGLIAGNSLPTGGVAHLETRRDDDAVYFTATARGPRARLKPEAVEGLSGKPLSDGLQGQWIQPHWLWSVVKEAGGTLEFTAEPERLTFNIRMPV